MVLFQTAKNVDFVHVLLQVGGQDVQVVFGDVQAAVSEYLLERNHRAAHGDPFLCEGVAEAMDTSFFDTAQVAIVPQGMIAAAPGELVAVDGDEEPIVGLPLSVLQVLMEYLHDILVQRDNQGLSVLRDIHIDDAIVEVQILDFDVHQAVLADASRQKQIDNDPTAVVGKVTSPYIGLPQQALEFCIGVGFDVVLVRLWDGDFKVRDVLAAHEEPQNGLQISCVSSKRNIVDVGVVPQSDDELRHRLL